MTADAVALSRRAHSETEPEDLPQLDPRTLPEANCRAYDPGVFFPSNTAEAAIAKEICDWCPLKAQCLEYALATNQRYGIWGGSGRPERQQIARQRRAAAAADAEETAA